MQTLGADFTEIQQELGFHLGFGRTISAWADEESKSVTAWIKSGLRRFLYSPIVPGLLNVYDWSFLIHSYSFSTQADQAEYDLPADFGSPVGSIVWDSATTSYRAIPIVNQAMVRAMAANHPTTTGVPQRAAIFSRRTSGATEQAQALVLFPTPDGTYPLRLSYDVLSEMLTDEFPWPPGGSPHARTLLYACLAEATKRDNDNESYEAAYEVSLAASINYDARRKGSNLGYNGDRTERYTEEERMTDFRVLVNGVDY